MRGARKQGDGAVRFRIAYAKPEALLEEFTHSVHQGCAPLTSLKPVAVGTRFVFEMVAEGVKTPVEVQAEVVGVQALDAGRFRVNLAYVPGPRGGLDDVVYRVLDNQKKERARKAPRVPLNIRARDDAPYSPGYVVRDLSLGGAGFEVEATALPKAVTLGAPVLLEMALRGEAKLRLRGVVVWAMQGAGRRSQLNSCFGVQFVEDLDYDDLEMLDKVVTLKTIPKSARISFASDAFGSHKADGG